MPWDILNPGPNFSFSIVPAEILIKLSGMHSLSTELCVVKLAMYSYLQKKNKHF